MFFVSPQYFKELIAGIKLDGGIFNKVIYALVIMVISAAGITVFSVWAFVYADKGIAVYILLFAGAVLFCIFWLVYNIITRLIRFAEKNPLISVFDGGQLLLHEQIRSKDKTNVADFISVENAANEQLTEEGT